MSWGEERRGGGCAWQCGHPNGWLAALCVLVRQPVSRAGPAKGARRWWGACVQGHQPHPTRPSHSPPARSMGWVKQALAHQTRVNSPPSAPTPIAHPGWM